MNTRQLLFKSIGLGSVIFAEMQHIIERRTGRSFEEFDVARNAATLPHVQALLVHDPADNVTGFRNAQRNHSQWKGSALYAPQGAGHHLGTAGVTRAVLAFLTDGTYPDDVRFNDGSLTPLPAMVTTEDLAVSGGISAYYK